MNKNTSGTDVVKALKSIMVYHGIPKIAASDNGSPFNSSEYLKIENESVCVVTVSIPEFLRSKVKAR